MERIRKGDEVIVTTGKDKGRRGTITRTYADGRVLVEGVNRIKKHTRVSRTQRGAQTGGIVTQEASIDVSNVMVVDSDGKPARVGYRQTDDGKRVRVSRRNGKDI